MLFIRFFIVLSVLQSLAARDLDETDTAQQREHLAEGSATQSKQSVASTFLGILDQIGFPEPLSHDLEQFLRKLDEMDWISSSDAQGASTLLSDMKRLQNDLRKLDEMDWISSSDAQGASTLLSDMKRLQNENQNYQRKLRACWLQVFIKAGQECAEYQPEKNTGLPNIKLFMERSLLNELHNKNCEAYLSTPDFDAQKRGPLPRRKAVKVSKEARDKLKLFKQTVQTVSKENICR